MVKTYKMINNLSSKDYTKNMFPPGGLNLVSDQSICLRKWYKILNTVIWQNKNLKI